MKYCQLKTISRDSILYLWCDDHNMVARHCAPNNSDVVCGVYAINYGCRCCKEHLHKCDELRIPLVRYEDGKRVVLGEIKGELVLEGSSVHPTFELDSDSDLWKHFAETYFEVSDQDRAFVTIKRIDRDE